MFREPGLALLLALACFFGCGAPRVRVFPVVTPDPDHPSSPLDVKESRTAVFYFISTECPVANGYVPEINRLCQRYASSGIRSYVVYTDTDVTPASAHSHARAYDIRCPILLDAHHELARAVGASTTPEAAVIGPGRAILYRGRIDDLYISLGNKRYAARAHDLQDALDAIVAGKPVPVARTSAVGCSISS